MLDRLTAAVAGDRRRSVLLLVTVGLGAGAPGVERSTSLEEFRGGTAEADASDYVDANRSGGEANVTQSLVVVRTTRPNSAPRSDRNVLTTEASASTSRHSGGCWRTRRSLAPSTPPSDRSPSPTSSLSSPSNATGGPTWTISASNHDPRWTSR
jgi:hypothetical protein